VRAVAPPLRAHHHQQHARARAHTHTPSVRRLITILGGLSLSQILASLSDEGRTEASQQVTQLVR
jgi:hypothetical protein